MVIWAQTSNCPAIILVRWSTDLKKNTSKLANRSGITIPLNIKATSKDKWRNPQHCETLGKEGRVSHTAHAMPEILFLEWCRWAHSKAAAEMGYDHHLLKRCGFGIRSIHALPLHPASVMPLPFLWGDRPWRRDEGWRRGKPALITLSFGTAVWAETYLQMSRLC